MIHRLAPLLVLVAAGCTTSRAPSVVDDLEFEADRLAVRLRTTLEEAPGRQSLFPDPVFPFHAAEVTYTLPVRNPGEATLDDLITRRLQRLPEPGEERNGIDDDGDGLVDEFALALTHRTGRGDEGPVEWIATGLPELAAGEEPNGVDDNGDGLIDEPAFAFTWRGERLFVTFTLARVEDDGTLRSATRTFELEP